MSEPKKQYKKSSSKKGTLRAGTSSRSRSPATKREDRGGRSYGDKREDRGGRSYGDKREDRGGRSYGDKREDRGNRSYGDRREDRVGRSYGDRREDRGNRSYGDKREDRGGRSYGDKREDRGGRSYGDKREDRGGRSYGDRREDRGNRSYGDKREDRGGRSYGDRREDRGNRSYGAKREDRGNRSYGDRREDRGNRSYGDRREDRGNRSYGAKREDRGGRSYGDKREDRGGRSYGAKREDRGGRSYGAKREDRGNRSYGDRREDRVGRSYGDRREDRGGRSYGAKREDRGNRSYGAKREDRGGRSYGDKREDRGGRSYGDKREDRDKFRGGRRPDKKSKSLPEGSFDELVEPEHLDRATIQRTKKKSVEATPPLSKHDSIDLLTQSIEGSFAPVFPQGESFRINRFLASAGFGSRREVEEIILSGRVSINGTIQSALDTKVVSSDVVLVDGNPVQLTGKHRYLLFNKPAGYTVSKRAFPNQPTIYDLLPPMMQNLKYAGRLDLHTRGLLLLSSDGHFIQQVTHPAQRVLKKYRVTVDKLPPERELQTSFLKGIVDNGELLRATRVSVLDREKGLVEVVLSGGKNRQLRRMFALVGSRVSDLYRYAIGALNNDELNIAKGEFVEFQPASLLHPGNKSKKNGTKDDAISPLLDFNPSGLY